MASSATVSITIPFLAPGVRPTAGPGYRAPELATGDEADKHAWGAEPRTPAHCGLRRGARRRGPCAAGPRRPLPHPEGALVPARRGRAARRGPGRLPPT